MFYQSSFKKLVWVAAVILVLSVAVSVYLFLYTQSVITVIKFIYEDPWTGTLYWRSASAGTFFPFPEKPGFFMVLVGLTPLDQFIYQFLLKTGLIFDITVIWWLGTFCYGLLFGIFLITKGRKTLPRTRYINEGKKTA